MLSRSISSAVKQRFPTLEHVVEAGILTSSVAEPHYFYAAPAPGKNFDAAPDPATPAPARAPTLR
jgi:hypothetical protein